MNLCLNNSQRRFLSGLQQNSPESAWAEHVSMTYKKKKKKVSKASLKTGQTQTTKQTQKMCILLHPFFQILDVNYVFTLNYVELGILEKRFGVLRPLCLWALITKSGNSRGLENLDKWSLLSAVKNMQAAV